MAVAVVLSSCNKYTNPIPAPLPFGGGSAHISAILYVNLNLKKNKKSKK